MPFLTQLWLFVTPVAYPTSLLPQRWRALYALNPMVGVVEGFRWALLGGARAGRARPRLRAGALVYWSAGALYFRRVERTFADVV